ncbi:hypothetical protein MJI20_30450, partial [Salmonella enterica subsp. enterica serovar Anatum]|nr:hypothetical protein [Salmonella enterica subsp. enterica serovar Anatum]
ALVNGGAAVKRHHAEPGVVDGNGAGVDSGGVAFATVGGADHHLNPELVEVLDVDSLAIHEEHLRGLITEHVQHTGSQRGEEILS